VQKAFDARNSQDLYQMITAVLTPDQAAVIEAQLVPVATDQDTQDLLANITKALRAARRDDLSDLIDKVEKQADKMKPTKADQ
jgi:hypothetical protein